MIPTAALALEASRIELKDGTLFENVTFKVDKDFKVITIEYGDNKRNVSFTDVATIFDNSGEDITVNVLGRLYVPSRMGVEPVEVFESADMPPGWRKHPYAFAIHAQPNYSLPSGDFYDGFTAGIG